MDSALSGCFSVVLIDAFRKFLSDPLLYGFPDHGHPCLWNFFIIKFLTPVIIYWELNVIIISNPHKRPRRDGSVLRNEPQRWLLSD